MPNIKYNLNANNSMIKSTTKLLTSFITIPRSSEWIGQLKHKIYLALEALMGVIFACVLNSLALVLNNCVVTLSHDQYKQSKYVCMSRG